MRVLLLVILAVALGGCTTDDPSSDAGTGTDLTVEGWVRDEALAPVVGARVNLPAFELSNTTDDEGHFVLSAPAAGNLLVVFEADGFVAQSRSIGQGSGTSHVMNVTLVRLPEAESYILVESFEGTLRCALTAVLQEDPNRPHEHQGVKCSDVAPQETSNNVWHYGVPVNASGVVFEVAWEAQTEFSRAMVLKVEVESSGQVLGFLEGMSIIRLQLPAFVLQELIRAGDTAIKLTLSPGAGSGSHEHGAFGIFIEQDFEIFASTFYNMPADPTYSIADER